MTLGIMGAMTEEIHTLVAELRDQNPPMVIGGQPNTRVCSGAFRLLSSFPGAERSPLLQQPLV